MNYSKQSVLTIRQILASVAVFAMVFSPFANVQLAGANHDPFNGVAQTKVEICHSGNGKNFVSNSPDISGTGANINLAGHEGHDHDIIPPFHYNDGDSIVSYEGKNWSPGVETWENECNDPDADYGSVTVNKVVVGGDAEADDFTLLVDDIELESGSPHQFVAGKNANNAQTYVISESGGPSDYNLTGIACQNESDDPIIGDAGDIEDGELSIPLVDGDSYVCTLTNTFDEPSSTSTEGTLSVVKEIVGTTTVPFGTFSFQVDGGAAVFFDADGQIDTEMEVDTYTVTEVANASYTTTYANSLNANANCSNLAVTEDDTTTCTITNTYKQPSSTTTTGTLVVLKEIVGTTTVPYSAFSYQVDGGTPVAFDVDGKISTEMEVDSYSVVEVTHASYTTTYANSLNANTNCTNLSVSEDATTTCTITNTLITGAVVLGCLDRTALNYSESATQDDGSCVYMCVYSDTQTDANGVPAVLSFVHDAWTDEFNDDDAEWIWEANDAQHATFTKAFYADEAATGTLRIAADNDYSVTLNGDALTCDGDGGNNHAVADTCVVSVDAGLNTLVVHASNLDGINNPPSNPAGLIFDIVTEDTACEAVNPSLGTISGTKYMWDTENGLLGWSIFIDENDNQVLDGTEDSVVTNVNGDFTFNNLANGTYDVCEVMQTGWEQTSPNTVNDCYEVTITDGNDVMDINFVNREIEPEVPDFCSVTVVSNENVVVTGDSDGVAEVLTVLNGGWTAITDAFWIWGDDPVNAPTDVDETQTFTKIFMWDSSTSSIATANLEIAADNGFRVVLNGTEVTDQLGDGSNYGATETFDVESLIVQGSNTLVIEVINTGVVGSDPVSNPAGLIYKLSVEGNEEDCDEPEVPLCEMGGNLLANNSFETPVADENVAEGGFWEIFDTVNNWAISSDGLEIWYNMFGGASDGNQNVELDGYASTTISQVVPTIPGAVYELRFDFAARPGTNVEDNNVDALVDGTVLINASADGSQVATSSWVTYTDTFEADATSTEIAFADKGTSNGVGTLVDNTVLCLTQMPENYSQGSYGGGYSQGSYGGGGGGSSRNRSNNNNDNDSNNDDEEGPVAQVLGETMSLMPLGAPNTGEGGTSHSSSLHLVSGILPLGTVRRNK